MKPYPITEELAEADRHARANPRDPGAAAHWVRCNVIENGKRCKRFDGHSEEHLFQKDEQ
jgi:hypothetical protein